MRVGTANIKNFPDMSRDKVAADARKMGGLCDLWGHQENDPREDDQVVMGALGDGWGRVLGDTNVPLYYRKDRIRLMGAKVHTVPLNPVLKLVPRPRLITGATFRLRARAEVPPWVVVNCHFIAGGYNGPQQPARRRQWNIEWRHLMSFVESYRAKGHTVFVMGDFNHPNPPKPTANFQWLVGQGIDRIGVSTRGRAKVDEIGEGTVSLNSDHDGQWTRVLLSDR